MNRAYSLLEVKAVNDGERVITGIATTPSPDRMGDVVEPLGAEFADEIPALWQHYHDEPVGRAELGRATAKGIPFTIRLASTNEPGPVKERLDKAWQDVKLGLVRAVSIGFRALEYALMEGGGVRFLKTEILELSLVTVPANADCTITSIKSIDTTQRAASGKAVGGEIDLTGATLVAPPPGASGKSATAIPVVAIRSKPKEAQMSKTIAERISAFQNARTEKSARMAAIMDDAGDETLDASQAEEHDNLDAEVKAIDAHIARLKSQEANLAATATPLDGVRDIKSGAEARGSAVQVKAQPKLEKGIGFARLAKVKALAKLDGESVRTVAKELYGEESDIYGLVTKAAVPAGTTAEGNWAGALVGEGTNVIADFVEFLRPRTILGRFGQNGVPALRNVPFNVPLVGQTSGGQGYWVGEGKAKPLTSLGYERNILDIFKVANIAVVTEELLRRSTPAAEGLIRDNLADAIAARLDTDFVNPAKAAVAGVSPASITNGLTAVVSTGGDADAIRADVRALMATFIAAQNAPTAGVWIMGTLTALGLSMMVNPLGQPEFPGISMTGGAFNGMPVIVSDYIGAGVVVLANASDIYLADEGGVQVDMSREASLEMADNPAHNSDTPTGATSLVSMFQTNSVAFRVERFINWKRRRPSAVAILTGATWGAPVEE